MYSYLAFDGDNVGRTLEFLMVVADESWITNFADHFRDSRDWFVRELKERGVSTVEVVFIGGDNGLLKVPTEELDTSMLKGLLAAFAERSEEWFERFLESEGHQQVPRSVSLSVGLGNSPREAFVALNVSKARGKNCLTHFEELTDG